MSGEQDLNPSVVVYDNELVPWLFDHWGESMVDLVAPEASSRIMDLACGSGLVVRHLLGHLNDSGRILGVDIDSAMLAYAATTVEDRRVSWHEADGARLPFESNSVDRVSCHQGLQFFPDRLAALAQIRRVLEPGGRLALATWGRLEDNPWPAALAGAVDRLFGEDAAKAMLVVCDLGDPRDVTELLREAGFDEIQVETRVKAATHRDVRAAAAGQISALPSGSAIGGLSQAQQRELVDLMCELLTGHVDAAGRLSLTSTSNLACATSADATV